MNDDSKDRTPDPPHEQELLRGRPFDLAEAIGREGGDALKGASPVAAHDQAIFAIEGLLESGLRDPEGSLTRTILARLDGDPPLVARHFGDPSGALRAFLDQVLAGAASLANLVRETDARWGREYQERPQFEREDSPPHADDPYTRDQVRTLLQRLRDGLDHDAGT